MFGIHRHFPTPGGGSTADATAEQWHIKNGKTAYIASGKVTGSAYTPAMLYYNGSSAYQSLASFSTSGSSVAATIRFKVPSFSGASTQQYLLSVASGSGFRILLVLYSSDYSTTTRRNKLSMICHASGFSALCRVFSSSDMNDDILHTAFVEFNAATGAAVMRIDGVDELDTGNAEHTLTTGTLVSGTMVFGVGADGSGGTNKTTGQIGYVGYRDASGLTWSNFMQTDGSPKDIESTLSTAWGATPPVWSPHGDLADNRGSGSDFTRNGTIVVGDGGAT